ncbi:MAG: VanZ family protein [Gemmatimonadales bacterium]
MSGRRLGTAVLLYLATAVAVITLAPFEFETRPVHGLTARWGVYDLVMNVVMFVPVGFVYALSRARARATTWATWLGAVALGALLSGAVELAQVFAPSRFPSLFDLAANTAGAGLGAWLAAAALAKAEAGTTVRALAVDLPLMGLVYLMAPLLWLVALGADDPERAWAMAPLAVGAAWAIASAFTSFEEATRSRVLFVTGAWTAVALLPGAVQRPALAAAVAAVALAVAWARTVAPAHITHETGDSGAPSRRFEAATLRVVLPLFAVYLVLACLLPWSAPTQGWSATLGLPVRGDLRDPDIYRVLEQIAAFTLLGYAVAEHRGRVRHGAVELLASILAWTIPAATLFQAIQGWHPAYRASGLLLALTIAAAVGGGRIYVLQLEHVRALAARPRPPRIA